MKKIKGSGKNEKKAKATFGTSRKLKVIKN